MNAPRIKAAWDSFAATAIKRNPSLDMKSLRLAFFGGAFAVVHEHTTAAAIDQESAEKVAREIQSEMNDFYRSIETTITEIP